MFREKISKVSARESATLHICNSTPMSASLFRTLLVFLYPLNMINVVSAVGQAQTVSTPLNIELPALFPAFSRSTNPILLCIPSRSSRSWTAAKRRPRGCSWEWRITSALSFAPRFNLLWT